MKRHLLIAAVSVPVAAFALFGGWSVTTVEDIPEYAVAGKPFDLTYSVRQHGFTLLTKLPGAVTASSGRETRNFGATELGEGMYRARVTIPTPGKWDMKINNGFVPKSGYLLPLEVIAANAPTPAPMPAYDRGHQLFLAKGCVTCHTHQLTRDFNVVQTGPDLSEPKFAAAYLTRFLANPSVKTDWRTDARMPNVGLDPAEIYALIAFLNKEKK